MENVRSLVAPGIAVLQKEEILLRINFFHLKRGIADDYIYILKSDCIISIDNEILLY